MTVSEAVIRGAFEEIFPNRDSMKYNFSVKYSGHFKDFGANIKMLGNSIQFGFSKKWRHVSREIQIGLMQELMIKLLGAKGQKNTVNIDLYNIFVKKLHAVVDKVAPEKELEQSFNRINEKYFAGMIEIPNIKWGAISRHTLGVYEYATDTVTINSILKDAEEDMLDFVMYHEVLHKKVKYTHKKGRSYHHTSRFRKLEKQFENAEEVEKKLQKLRIPRSYTNGFVRKSAAPAKRRKLFGWF